MELMDELSWQWSIIICFLLFVLCIYIFSNFLSKTNNSNILLFGSVNICSVCLYIVVSSSCRCVKCCPIYTSVFVHLCILFYLYMCRFVFYSCKCVHFNVLCVCTHFVLFLHVYILDLYCTCVNVCSICTCDNLIS
jgi:hypothetical protein